MQEIITVREFYQRVQEDDSFLERHDIDLEPSLEHFEKIHPGGVDEADLTYAEMGFADVQAVMKTEKWIGIFTDNLGVWGFPFNTPIGVHRVR